MSDNVRDKRQFYRIEDSVGLGVGIEFCITNEETVYDDSASFPIEINPHLQLLSQLRSIDAEQRIILRSISEKDRNLAAYLKGFEQKIELLAQTLLDRDESLTSEYIKVITLSEGGLSFYNHESIERGRFIALKATFFETSMSLLLYGKVANHSSDNNGNHMISISFENLLGKDRALIARHVLLFQAKQRRTAAEQI